ncbi:hypothetical protein [Vineibacter terrae]|uniref:hypothetical protein n=1 Tax=Vineibacter terrae TaxID=2586908 RepID=UPI002E36DD39|nr:hypothetical protein [Vineibacter terrae]HEX2888082.1 hypothetical protein [Vineibacter terrae]
MSRKSRIPLIDRVFNAAEEALAAQHYVAPIDVLIRIGWLNHTVEASWRQGRVASLVDALQAHPDRVVEAMELLRTWATRKGLIASETRYVARAVDHHELRFTPDGNPAAELVFRTHWVSPALPEKKRERLTEKQSRAPELVAVMPLKHTWKCHRCGGTGDLLVMENAGPACLGCVGLGDLEFVPSGDALLTRRVKARSARNAVVVRFSRSRRRYERQGLLVEPQALADVQRELEKERGGA